MWVARLSYKISEHSQYQLLHKTTCFFFIRTSEKSSTTLNFFQSLANDDDKVNKTQRISTKIHSELDSFSGFWWKLQNSLWNYVKKEEKDSVMESLYAMFQIREAVGRSQMFFKMGALKIFLRISQGVGGLKRSATLVKRDSSIGVFQ